MISECDFREVETSPKFKQINNNLTKITLQTGKVDNGSSKNQQKIKKRFKPVYEFESPFHNCAFNPHPPSTQKITQSLYFISPI